MELRPMTPAEALSLSGFAGIAPATANHEAVIWPDSRSKSRCQF